ncbi:hypothetical protein RRG08_035173 [Elysia crispata]|uniref:Uncharacterized protein n=1 Tax=Elysia crispata TaxID=231223 RepID=A0AAE1AZ74_9GAST|nr:hypothetical protein RRG08_035173 [Elysia crispata]
MFTRTTISPHVLIGELRVKGMAWYNTRKPHPKMPIGTAREAKKRPRATQNAWQLYRKSIVASRLPMEQLTIATSYIFKYKQGLAKPHVKLDSVGARNKILRQDGQLTFGMMASTTTS